MNGSKRAGNLSEKEDETIRKRKNGPQNVAELEGDCRSNVMDRGSGGEQESASGKTAASALISVKRPDDQTKRLGKTARKTTPLNKSRKISRQKLSLRTKTVLKGRNLKLGSRKTQT